MEELCHSDQTSENTYTKSVFGSEKRKNKTETK